MFVDPSGLANKYFIDVFAGINTNIGSFEQAAAEIKRQLLEKDKEATVNCITIYPYDDTISGDLIDDVKQVVGNAYELSWSSVSQMAAQVKSKFKEVGGADYIHFVGYSGGGVAASRVAEKLSDDEWTPYISSIIRVGSPNLAINNWYWGYRTQI